MRRLPSGGWGWPRVRDRRRGSWWIIHTSRRDSSSSSQTRSQGRTRKSPVTAASTSGRRRMEPVGVSSWIPSGESMSGLGDKEERYGFWARPSWRALDKDVGVMRVTSEIPARWHQSTAYHTIGRLAMARRALGSSAASVSRFTPGPQSTRA